MVANIGEGLNLRRCQEMNVTEDKCKDRQLHNEGHLQMVSAEQREYAEASACSRIAENTGIITDLQMTV